MANRLAESTSPYLKQHETNPIDWYPWGDEAFAKAKELDRPIFLSIGYSSCHWCHVMAHETFEDDAVAVFLNQHFINIKVDREERPDVDEVYMTAVKIMSQRGGWPMTLFLTPDKKPFFAGTYFPKVDRGQYPGFTTLIQNIAQIWQTQKGEVLKSAEQVSDAVQKTLSRQISSLTSKIENQLFVDCFNALRSDFDAKNGGFGQAPKFPSHTALAFLLDYAGTSDDHAVEALSMVFQSLEAMALGGIHDHVLGGFHRYSTDAEFLLPHFEKMLCDNGLLLQAYVRAAQIAHAAGSPQADLFERSAIGIIQWLKAQMLDKSGLFYSAIDADSEGEEGIYYIWSNEELRALLGDLAEPFIAAYQCSDEGNYLDEATRQKTGMNILHLKQDTDGAFEGCLEILRSERKKRVTPLIDNKAIAAWNAHMIRGLVEADELMLAEMNARVWMQKRSEFGRLPHQITNGIPSGHPFLDDVATMILALAELSQSTGIVDFYNFATDLADYMVAEFKDQEKGGFFYTSKHHEQLMGRSKPAMDQSLPSANALAIRALTTLGRREEALEAMMAILGWAQKVPQAAESLIHAALFYVSTDLDALGDLPELDLPKPVLGKVTAKLSQREVPVGPDGWAYLTVYVDVPEGLHLNTANPPARWLVATQVKVEPVKAQVEYPEGENDQYEGPFEIPVKLDGASAPAEFELRLIFQACTNTECQAPSEIVLDGVIVK